MTTDLELVSWGGSQKWLPLIIPYFFIKSLWIYARKGPDHIHLGDALLSPLGLILKSLFKRPVSVTVHGLDVTWKFRLYQFLVPRCLKRLDKIICVSEQTRKECIIRGVDEEKIVVIPNGVDPEEFYITEGRLGLKEDLSNRLKIDLGNKKILLSVGRLVERKGFHWFISETLPRAIGKRGDVLYLIVGKGPFAGKIRETVRDHDLRDHVLLLGEVDNGTLRLLYNVSDVLVMPNIKVEGDIEGFGLVALEAASCGLPVVASNLEGIKDAIKHEKNGFLIEPYDAQEFTNVIIKLLKNDEKRQKFGEEAKIFVLQNYSWKTISRRHLEEFTGTGAR